VLTKIPGVFVDSRSVVSIDRITARVASGKKTGRGKLPFLDLKNF
jgi:hypothetical protein